MYVLYVCMWFNRLLSNYSAPETAAEPIASGEGVSRTLIRAMGRSQVYLKTISSQLLLTTTVRDVCMYVCMYV